MADYYFAAGDLVSCWRRGLTNLGKIMKPRAGSVIRHPAHTKTAVDIAEIL